MVILSIIHCHIGLSILNNSSIIFSLFPMYFFLFHNTLTFGRHRSLLQWICISTSNFYSPIQTIPTHLNICICLILVSIICKSHGLFFLSITRYFECLHFHTFFRFRLLHFQWVPVVSFLDLPSTLWYLHKK